jgi:hypothetical protein
MSRSRLVLVVLVLLVLMLRFTLCSYLCSFSSVRYRETLLAPFTG